MTIRDVRISLQTVKVLSAFLQAGPRELAGVDVALTAKLQSGTLYPILKRLEDAGWLSSRWEDLDAREEKRPRRRYYKLTGHGATRAVAIVRELSGVTVHPAWEGAFA